MRCLDQMHKVFDLLEVGLGAVLSAHLHAVHDELILEVAPGEGADLSRIVKEQMSNAFKLRVPLDVNIGIGKSWDAAAH